MCTEPGCSKSVVAGGLCGMHYKRLQRHGHLKQTRPQDWGLKEKHPLYESWQYHKRSFGGIKESWKKDFWEFVAFFKERPSIKTTLRKKDVGLPLDENNWEWYETSTTPSTACEYQKEYRKKYPARVKNATLRKMYGITLEEYNRMLTAQNNVCAICKSAPDKIALAVDHCHSTGKIRGLLCANCNKILGHAKDNVVILREAINYLGCVSSMMYGGEGEASPRHF